MSSKGIHLSPVSMQSFIANALREITDTLTAPIDPRSSATPVRLPGEHILDGSIAEIVNGGSYIFPNSGRDSETDWCVLSGPANPTASTPNTFRFRGRLRGDLKPEDFVERAYQLVLMRNSDPVGRSSYVSKLTANLMTRRILLASLARSPEARDLKVRFLIVPEPSSWLSSLGVIEGNDPLFPPLTISIPSKGDA